MKKLILILLVTSFVFAAYVDELTITIYDSYTQELVESVMVTLDTAGAEAETVYTDGNRGAVFTLDKDETFLFRMSKTNYYYKDSLIYSYDAALSGVKDTMTIGIGYFLDPVMANYCVNVNKTQDADTIVSYIESLYVDIVNQSDDTIISGYTDSLGNFAFDPALLTNNITYWAYVTDEDSVYVNDYMTWTHKPGNRKIINVVMDSLASVTTNDVTVYTYHAFSGYPQNHVAVKVTLAWPSQFGSAGDTKIATNNTKTQTFYSDTDGRCLFHVPDNTWVSVNIPAEYGNAHQFFSTQDTIIGQEN
jgi:hypothetical protein